MKRKLANLMSPVVVAAVGLPHTCDQNAVDLSDDIEHRYDPNGGTRRLAT